MRGNIVLALKDIRLAVGYWFSRMLLDKLNLLGRHITYRRCIKLIR